MKKSITFLFFAACSLVIFGSWVQSEDGKAGYTNSPGESNCTGCHASYPLNSGGGSVSLTSNMINSQYVAGQTYTINVTVKRAGMGLFGFGTEILNGVDNAGTLVITNAAKTVIKTKTVGGIVRNNVVHTLGGGASSDSAVFTFDWTAPATNIGNVKIYYAGAACDNNQGDDNDYIYVDSLLITPGNVGINQITNSFSVNVYPNPVTDFINLDYYLSKPSMVNAQLISTGGQVAQTLFNEIQQAGQVAKSIKLPKNLAIGIYFVRINLENETLVRKVVVR